MSDAGARPWVFSSADKGCEGHVLTEAMRVTCYLSAAQLPKSLEAVTSFLRVTYGAHTVKEGAPSPSGYDGGRFQLVSQMPHTFRRD